MQNRDSGFGSSNHWLTFGDITARVTPLVVNMQFVLGQVEWPATSRVGVYVAASVQPLGDFLNTVWENLSPSTDLATGSLRLP